MKTVWVFGDKLVDSVSGHLEKLIDKAPDELYLTKNYQVECFNTENKRGYFSNNFLVRISNSFITALNSAQAILPTAVVIMLSNNFLKDEYFAERAMPSLVEKLLENIHQTIRHRKKQVDHRYVIDNFPRVILLRPIPRPAYSLINADKYKGIRRKFSSELERITYHFRVALVNLDELNCSQRVLFNDYGNLSDYGVEKFWQSISDYFRRTDRDEYNAIKLFRVPKKTQGTQTQVCPLPASGSVVNKNQPAAHHSIVSPPNQIKQNWYPPQYHQQAGDYNSNLMQNNNNYQANLPPPQHYQPNDRYHVNRK